MASPVYEALNKECLEIRLVTVLPATEPFAPIECSLYSVCLQENHTYTALSYAWGDPTVTASVIVNGIECHVTTNLESALRHIRDDVDHIVLWVDAICINQNNMLERNHQVQLMRQIYSNVDVLVWLGDEGDDSDQAMKFIGYWAPGLEQVLSGGDIKENYSDFWEPRAWDIIHCLFNRPWWTRLWTVQEVALGREVAVMCGYKTLAWNLFMQWLSVSVRLEESEAYRTAGPSTLTKLGTIMTGYLSSLRSKVALREEYQKNPSSIKLLDLLSLFRNFQTTNPLDKVYALLGLAADSSDFMEPNYTMSVSTVYTSVAHTAIKQEGIVDILHYSGRYPIAPIDSFELPSWVPDWRISQEQSGITLKNYCAARQTKALIRVSLEFPLRLFVHGIVYGHITLIEPPGYVQPHKAGGMPLILRTWRYNDSDTCLSNIPRLQEYFRTLLLDRDIVTGDRLSLDNESFYDSLVAFIYHWMQCGNYCDPLSQFLKWMAYIDAQDEGGCLEIADFEPFIGSPNLESGNKWCGEVGVAKRGAKFCVGLLNRFSKTKSMKFYLNGERAYGPCAISNERRGHYLRASWMSASRYFAPGRRPLLIYWRLLCLLADVRRSITGLCGRKSCPRRVRYSLSTFEQRTTACRHWRSAILQHCNVLGCCDHCRLAAVCT
jgi:hypothetical protein